MYFFIVVKFQFDIIYLLSCFCLHHYSLSIRNYNWRNALRWNKNERNCCFDPNYNYSCFSRSN